MIVKTDGLFAALEIISDVVMRILMMQTWGRKRVLKGCSAARVSPAPAPGARSPGEMKLTPSWRRRSQVT